MIGAFVPGDSLPRSRTLLGQPPGHGRLRGPRHPPHHRHPPQVGLLFLLLALLGTPSALCAQAPLSARQVSGSDDPLTDEWEDDWIEPTPTEDPIPEGESPWAFDLRDGLRFRGPDGVPRLHLGGRVQVSAYHRDERNNRKDSAVLFEEGEIRLDGEALERTWLTVVADLDGRDTTGGLRRAVFATQVHSALRLSVGLQESPIGIESGFDRDAWPFLGPAFGSWLVERTDLGARIDGEVLGGFLSYDVGYGAGEGFDLDGERLDDPRASARLTLYPLTENVLLPTIDGGMRPLHGLFASAGFAWETAVGRSLVVETPNRDRLFETSRISADSAHWWSFGWGIDAGPVRLTHEWLRGSLEDVRVGAQKIDLRDQLTAMEMTLSVRIAGDDYDSHPSRQRPVRHVHEWIGEEPPESLLPEFSFPGEVELAVRYANGDLDRRLFELGLADYGVSSQEFRTFTGAASMRPARNLLIAAEVTRVIADQNPAAFSSHGRDTTVSLRLVIEF